ncbi:hypothetical protein QF027_007986 [Streptomyces canus]|nr:hypothetical protein [Streptomyces canus]
MGILVGDWSPGSEPDGTPLAHIEAYFGLSNVANVMQLVPMSEWYDREIAPLMEETFAS